MPDLTVEMMIGSDWTEITGPLNMVDGSTYLVSVNNIDSHGSAYTAETDTALPAPSAGIIGHPILPATHGRGLDSRVYPKRANVFAWIRCDRGGARVTATRAT